MTIDGIILSLIFALLASGAMISGSALFLSMKQLTEKRLSFFLGLSAGAMIYISFIELFSEAASSIGFPSTNIFFFIGLLIMGILDKIGPHFLNGFCNVRGIKTNEFTFCGLFVAISMSLHKILEGAALAVSVSSNIKFGVLLSLAIIAHNFPEGIAYAVPLRAAKIRRRNILFLTIFSSFMTIVGALLSFIIFSVIPLKQIEPYLYALIAGVMIYISLDELLPASFKHDEGHRALLGIMTGMALVAIGVSVL